jgi:hypothetical protein
VYIGAVGVEKRSPKGCFSSRELQAHDGRNRSHAVRQFVLRDVL